MEVLKSPKNVMIYFSTFRCVTDSNIIRIEGNPGHSARFSFAYYDYWEEPVIKEYIACRLSMCAIDKSAQTSDMHMVSVS